MSHYFKYCEEVIFRFRCLDGKLFVLNQCYLKTFLSHCPLYFDIDVFADIFRLIEDKSLK